MARRKKQGGGGGGGGEGWLVTFSDLMTLLLTFFVLLLSMSSLDRTMLTRISALRSELSPIGYSGSGKIPERIQLALEMLKDPQALLEQRDRIKDLLFPQELLPAELSPGMLEENLRLLAHPEGLVIVMTEALLFPQGSYTLSSAARSLLQVLTPLLHYSSADVAISGYTDDRPEPGADSLALSGQRAMSVLDYFLHEKFKPSRFSVSGYGAMRPLYPNVNPGNRAKNRRVEILLKTVQWLGRYQ